MVRRKTRKVVQMSDLPIMVRGEDPMNGFDERLNIRGAVRRPNGRNNSTLKTALHSKMGWSSSEAGI